MHEGEQAGRDDADDRLSQIYEWRQVTYGDDALEADARENADHPWSETDVYKAWLEGDQEDDEPECSDEWAEGFVRGYVAEYSERREAALAVLRGGRCPHCLVPKSGDDIPPGLAS